MSMSDQELLQRYVDEGANDAFAALVARHLDLVYSVARRQVQSATLAEDVAQAVFIELAQNARRLKSDTPLIAWLHLVSRRRAINAVRDEARRRVREQQAAEIAAMKTNPPEWACVEPLLDEAVESLDAADRTAILLRYFENKSLRDVGTVLGISDDTAQKRVSRSVERLRDFFLRRGVAVSAAGLATNLSAHALHHAPSGLGASICAATAILPPAAATAVHLAMTTAQKIVVGTSLSLALGAGLYQASALVRQTDSIHSLEARTGALHREIAQLQREPVNAKHMSPPNRAPEAVVNASVHDVALEKEMQAWMERAVQLKLLLADRPELTIPEIRQFFSEQDFFDFARNAKFGSEEEIRDTLAGLRHSARNTFGNKLRPALQAYLAAHDNNLPATLNDLLPSFDPPLDPAILTRYRLTRAGKTDDIPRNQRTNVIEEIAVPDERRDSRLRAGIDGFSLTAFDPIAPAVSEARRNFGKKNPSLPIQPSELLPYFDPPLSTAEQQSFLQKGEWYLAP